MENVMLQRPMNTTAHPDAMRRHYAALFNTSDYMVRWWDELTPRQQEGATAQFSGYKMDGYVYECGMGGGIIARHERCAHDRQERTANTNVLTTEVDKQTALRNVAAAVLQYTEVKRSQNGRGRCAIYAADVDTIAQAARQLAEMVLGTPWDTTTDAEIDEMFPA